MDDFDQTKDNITLTKHNDNLVNVSTHLKRMAEIQPYKRAVICPVGWDEKGRVAYTHLTFLQLDQESDYIAHGLENVGITRGTRTILMVRPCLEFFALTFALFKIGAIPVVVDPGMGIRRMVRCLRESRPEAFIGIPLAHVIRKIYPGFFKTIKTWVTVGRRWFWGGFTLENIRQTLWETYPAAPTRQDETAAILFTTGSTGPAKGVVYTHGMFDTQVRRLKSHFGIAEGEIDLPTFPLFALFDPALGMTAVIPDMDPTKPAQVNPEKIIEAILNQGVTNMFASPALLNRVGSYGKEMGIKLPCLRRIVSAGAPVSPENIEQFSSMLSEGTEIHTPYGATEAMPIISIGSNEILSSTRKFTDQGYGMCVGRPLEETEVRIIRITDDPIEEWSDDLVVERGDTGEITVKSGLVSRHYFDRPKADSLAKIRDGNDVWHRMGDLAWEDNKGRIWFCGRKGHRVVTENGTLFTIPCEAVFNNHDAVLRSALVGVGDPPEQKPIICIELKNGGKNIDKHALKKELLNLAARNPMTEEIKTILFHKGFPVDIRHNSKIFREKLAKWAT
ncbi:fatty acid CoA ligase family protein [Desulfonema magnum]|uniref:AMP-dependent synthetase/ligase n=1 Tax=Desulfonema magnum TaxID=45655 RepID=A0A975BW25_9BACT|nr:fatty acid CoA ligase family protein [Desulfonema magnum]QTA92811.1 AMP-dependent synthetase/ligase [Desulfonema magnum]